MTDNEHNIFLFSCCSDLLLEATECLLLPKRKSQIHSHRMAPRRPTSVNHVMYAIGGMSRREASKSGEKYDPRERKWKPVGKDTDYMQTIIIIIIIIIIFNNNDDDDDEDDDDATTMTMMMMTMTKGGGSGGGGDDDDGSLLAKVLGSKY